MFTPEETDISIGFMPLSDCAPLVVAEKLGFFQQNNLNVQLVRQNSWATLRDKLLAGYLDMAQMLAPMPLAMHLGLGSSAQDMTVPMILSYNGNGITLSNALFAEVQQAGDESAAQLLSEPLSAQRLSIIAKERRSQGQKKLCFAAVFPYSCHYYQLVSWLQQGGLSADDVDIRIIPPSGMVQALAENEIDGFCVGSPWNAAAVRAGIGATVIASCEIWHNTPEKVLGLTRAWQAQHPQSLFAVIDALKKACQWLASKPNRFEAARWLAEPEYVGSSLDSVAPALLDSCLTTEGVDCREIKGHTLFQVPQKLNQPTPEQGIWLLQQMQRSQHLPRDTDLHQVIRQVYTTERYDDAPR